jgi:DNA-directed RNA polymerase specialized sigma24 family protein
MSFSRRYFNMSRPGGDRAPSDEMLAIDAVGEMRSFTLLYERYADRLYRYFLIYTGDSRKADVLFRSFLRQLKGELVRFRPEDISFAGWLFRRASRRLNQERSQFLRIYRRFFESGSAEVGSDNSMWSPSGGGDFERINAALRHISDADREVIAISLGANLGTMPVSQALRLPASLVSSHVTHAVRKVGEVLDDSSDPARLSQHLQEVFGALSVSGAQRQGHLSLIHSLFFGGSEIVDERAVEETESRSTLLRDISALAGIVVLGLIGIWVWGLFTPGDPRMPDRPAAEVSIGSQPDPTATPEPTVEPEAAIDEAPQTCMAYESKAIFDTFVRRYNEGNFEAVREMLPTESYDHPLFRRGDMEMNPDPEDYFHHQDASFSNPEDIVDYLQQRYEAGERWHVMQAFPAEHYNTIHGASPIEMYVQWKQDNPELGIIVVGALERSADDFQTHKALGRAIIDCAERRVIEWNIQPNESLAPEPVEVDEFLSVMDELAPGEQREIRSQRFVVMRPSPDLDGSVQRALGLVRTPHDVALVCVVVQKPGQFRSRVVSGLVDSPPEMHRCLAMGIQRRCLTGGNRSEGSYGFGVLCLHRVMR